MSYTVFICGYLLTINIITFVGYGLDKRRARRSEWRISEANLLLLAFLGGALGAWIGMRVFRHKTKHWKFRILVPLMLALWIAGIGCVVWTFIN